MITTGFISGGTEFTGSICRIVKSMTPQEAKANRRKLQREIVNELKAQDRIKLHHFDELIHGARVERGVRIAEARALCRAAIIKLRQEKRSTRAELRNIERAGKAPRLRSTSRERVQESDDAVRRDIPHELIPVFDRVKGRIKGTARLSRSEAFLHWAHENPDEIVMVQQKEADRYLADLLKSQKQHKTTMRKAGRYRLTPAELEARLANVPF